MDMGAPSGLSIEVNGCLGILTLEGGVKGARWLTLPLLRDIHRTLLAWVDRSEVQAVLLTGGSYADGAEGFGASFSPEQLSQLARTGPDLWAAHYAEAYAVCELIHAYPKPLIALMGGDATGAALGLASGARLRVVGDGTQFSAPQARSGFLPDLGMAVALASCAGSMGEWLALSGESIGAADAIALGMADVYVPAHEWARLGIALRQDEQLSAEHVVATVMERVELAPESPHMPDRRKVDACFDAVDATGIQAALRANGSEWALRTAGLLEAATPEALTGSLRLVRSLRHEAQPLACERSAVLAFQSQLVACRES